MARIKKLSSVAAAPTRKDGRGRMSDPTMLSMIFNKIADVKTSLFLAIASGLALFVPDGWAHTFGIAEPRTEYALFFGLAFLLSAGYLISSILIGSWESMVRKYKEIQYFKAGRKQLTNMTEDERAVLRHFMHKGKSKVGYPVGDGTICLLEMKGVVLRASVASTRGVVFDYVLQPWAREELEKHPEHLDVVAMVTPDIRIDVRKP